MLDRGDFASVLDAEAQLRALRVQFHIDAAQADAYEHQSTLLTAVALAQRVFLGGVFVSGELDVPLVVPVSIGKTLREAMSALGALTWTAVDDTPLVYIGGSARPRSKRFAVRTVCAGWRGGLLPAHSDALPSEIVGMPVASVLAAGLAVNEAFLAVTGDAPAAGKRSIGLSLWSPGLDDWLHDDGAPELVFLPSRLWLIGLGHLGQAYLWCLGILPYPETPQLELMLQDFDRTTPSTWSTSVLTAPPDEAKPSCIGIRKTRLMAEWAEQRGFTTAICERRFDAHVRRQNHEPSVALCGVDNAIARRALDKVGFEFIVSAGLGSGYNDFRTIRIHTLPAQRKAEEIWPDIVADLGGKEASVYEPMIAAGAIDRCGAAMLAGVAVGAPFVGAVAAALAISEVLRLLHGGVVNRLIDLDLTGPEHKVVLPQRNSLLHLNLGYVSRG
jgi:hypothetical protein